jgi:23S rRNA (cytidine1920-2'-O)/16S rRNA (cytidine1409-2'-O)-methyltransferase
MPKQRADMLLVERGICESREKAKRAIMAGKVFANGHPVFKPSDTFCEDAKLELKAGEQFVSRGGFKLEHALNHFGLDVSGMVAVDIGASTGGFTDCLLQRGASKVFAVDVGKGQLSQKLQRDHRVVVMDKTNARYLKPDFFPEAADVVTIDASFISLTKLLPAAVSLLKPHGFVIALVKPQFEAGREHVGKGGVVRDESVRLGCVEKVTRFATEKLGMRSLGAIESPLPGPAGNKEFLVCLKKQPRSVAHVSGN